MIDLNLEDFAILIVGGGFLLVSILIFITWIRRKYIDKKAQQDVFYCNICVQYHKDESKDKNPVCPTCQRAMVRGRKRNLG